MSTPTRAFFPTQQPMTLALALWLVVLFIASFVLFTRHNNFALHYHPDEPGKVRQIESGEYNFHHPLLLLDATKAALGLKGGKPDSQQIVETGRAVSAAFGALAVVALAFAAWRLRGMPGALVTGLLLTTHHQLFELAHYMKEDTAMLAGVALVFAMMALSTRGVRTWHAAALGAACAIAISGKYLGAMMLPFAAVFLWRENGRADGGPKRGGAAWAAFFIALLVTLCVVNLPFFTHYARFRESFGREMEFVAEGQKGTTHRVPNTEYLRTFVDNTTPALWLFLAWHLVVFWRSRRGRSLFEWLLPTFPFLLMLGLCCSPKSNDRYFLPVTACFTLLAALGALDCAEFLRRCFALRGAVFLCAGVALAAQIFSPPAPLKWKSLSEYWRAFQHDDRAELRAWLTENLPPDAVVMADSRVLLPVTDSRDEDNGPPLRQRVVSKKSVNPGTLDELRRSGVTHVVVSESDYGRYFREGLRPKEGFRDKFDRERGFYDQLFRDGELLWSRDYGTVIYLHPGIRVYRLKPAGA